MGAGAGNGDGGQSGAIGGSGRRGEDERVREERGGLHVQCGETERSGGIRGAGNVQEDDGDAGVLVGVRCEVCELFVVQMK